MFKPHWDVQYRGETIASLVPTFILEYWSNGVQEYWLTEDVPFYFLSITPALLYRAVNVEF
jgi:hypothetical protein